MGRAIGTATAAFLLFTSLCVTAQESGSRGADEATSNPPLSDPDSASLYFVLSDNHGRPAPGVVLSKEDVQLEDKSGPVEVLEVRSAPDVPLRLALVLDLSGSLKRGGTSYLSPSIVEFFRRTLRPGLDTAIVVAFNDKVTKAAPFDAEQLSEELPRAAFRGETALYEAIYLASQDLAASARGPERRVILLLSDGENTMRTRTLEEAIAAAQQARVAIYAMDIVGPPHKSGPRALRRLADETGGRVFFPDDLKDAQRKLAEIGSDLAPGYLLVCRPAKLDRNDDKFRKTRIRITKDRNLRVRAQMPLAP